MFYNPRPESLACGVSGIAQTPHNWQKKTGERGWLDEHHSCHRQSLHDHEVEEELLAHPLLSVQGHPDPRYSRRLRDDHKKMQRFHNEHNDLHIKMGCFVMWCETVTQKPQGPIGRFPFSFYEILSQCVFNKITSPHGKMRGIQHVSRNVRCKYLNSEPVRNRCVILGFH